MWLPVKRGSHGGLEVAGQNVDGEIQVQGPSAHDRVGLAHKRPLAAHGMDTQQQVLIWKLDNSPVTI